MSEGTRRERGREETDHQIRRQARALLVSQGPEAVTLRAIARELGITAPALYRYYSSREDLVEHLRMDVCADLADELTGDLGRVPDTEVVGQVLAICRGFRRWALAHPQEFTLVFASPAEPTSFYPGTVQPLEPGTDPFGRIFLAVAGKVLTTLTLNTPPDDSVPADLRDDLAKFRASLLKTIAETGFEVAEETLGIGTAYAILRFWVRLYGQVALEVFGRFPFAVSNPEPLFETMLIDVAADVGLIE
jgi:AcrR family transcriptional regulator